MDISLDELKDLGLMPSDEAIIVAREGKKQADLEAARAELASAEEAARLAQEKIAALTPVEEVAETPAEEYAEVQG